MLKIIAVIIISFLSVVGLFECVATLLESIATSKYTQVTGVELKVGLKGCVPNIEFLLGSLMLQAERIYYKNSPTKVVINDCGLDDNTYIQICDFCVANDNISIEISDNM